MNSADIISKIAFIQCDGPDEKPCADCVKIVEADITFTAYVTTDLIEKAALSIRRNSGDTSVTDLTPLELSFAFSVLSDVVPYLKDNIKYGYE